MTPAAFVQSIPPVVKVRFEDVCTWRNVCDIEEAADRFEAIYAMINEEEKKS